MTRRSSVLDTDTTVRRAAETMVLQEQDHSKEITERSHVGVIGAQVEHVHGVNRRFLCYYLVTLQLPVIYNVVLTHANLAERLNVQHRALL